jgi:putative spermidine/putrescine transport system ATP-binding protein
MRPEALTVRPASRPADAIVHRVTDFGMHKIVDIDLADGTRLKAMVAPTDMIRAGMVVAPSCSGFFAFRDNALIHQSASAEAAASVQPLFTA